MNATLTPADLIAFEDEIARLFIDRRILSPVHLAGGNEEQLIDIFREHVEPDDWICCSWRSHYHCLLKGVPPEQLRAAILAGHSITLCFPEHRILSSAIVGGTAPIAVGLAMGIKRRGGSEKVVCFVGDMTAESGIVHEAMKYSHHNKLPLLWIIEDNGKSVCTDTGKAWGYAPIGGVLPPGRWPPFPPNVTFYEFELTRPHVGVGQWVSF